MSSAVLAADAQLIFRTIKQVPTSFDPDPSLGAYPAGNLIEGREGALYGTMSSNGVPAGANGTVFRVNKDGSGYTLLWRFTNAPGDGAAPLGGLVQASDGSLCGTTSSGGGSNLGTVFKLSDTGFNTYTNQILRSFGGPPGDGSNPRASLLLGSDGWLYGTTFYGGTSNKGMAFKLRTDGSGYTPLRSFSGATNDASSGDISLSTRTLDLNILSVNPTATNSSNDIITFSTSIQVGNSRATAPAALRLQFVALPGFSQVIASNAPLWLPPVQVLSNYFLANPTNVAPRATTNVSVANLICPGPTNYVYGGVSNYVGWGVFVLLQ